MIDIKNTAPDTSEDVQKVLISVKLPLWAAHAVDRYRKPLGIKRTDVVRLAVYDYLKLDKAFDPSGELLEGD